MTHFAVASSSRINEQRQSKRGLTPKLTVNHYEIVEFNQTV